MALKQQTDFSNFMALDIRLGKIVKVEESQAKKPTYRITADFGPEAGQKVTIGAYKHYTPEELTGLSVLGVINVGIRKMGPEVSEFLLLGAPNDNGDAVPFTSSNPMRNLAGKCFRAYIALMKTPVLETERLILRPVTLDDAPAKQKYFNNWNVIKYLNTVVPWPYPESGAIDWLNYIIPQMQAGEMCEWGIWLKEAPHESIGAITVKEKKDGTIQRDFWLAEPFWNKGYMTEAIYAINDFIFFELNATVLQISNAISNIGSRRVKQKTGAIFIKTISQEYHNGDKVGELWEITKENWKKFKQRPSPR